MVFHHTDSGSHSHAETAFLFNSANRQANEATTACTKCVFKWHNTNHILNSCRREIHPEQKNSFLGRARTSVGTITQRMIGADSKKLLACMQRRVSEIVSGEFTRGIATGRCQAACNAFSSPSGGQPSAITGGNAAPMQTNPVTDENGLSDVIIPTLAHKLVESRRRIEIASAFL